MASYYVLIPPASRDPDMGTMFIRDGFSWIGFLLPLPWLLVRRMWLLSAIAALLYILTSLVATSWNLGGLPMAYSLILSLWVGIEGSHARARTLEKKGWQLARVLSAETEVDAEEAYFADRQASAAARETPLRPFPSLPKQANTSTNIAALGLIDPRGAR